MKNRTGNSKKKHTNKKTRLRFLSVFLIALLLVLDLAAGDFNAADAMNLSDDAGLTIYRQGEPVDSVLLGENEKQTLTAEGLSADADYQWQVRMPGRRL